LIAAAPPLALYAQNPSSVMWWETPVALAGMLLLCGVTYFIARRLYTSQRAAALAASWTMVLLFGYGLVFQMQGPLTEWGLPFSVSPSTVLPLWGAVLVFGLWWLGRRRVDLNLISTAATVFGAFAAVGPLVMIGVQTGGDLQSLLAKPVKLGAEDPVVLKRPAAPPDVYYLVVSGYANDATLRREFHCDNSGFLKGLERRGFVVAEDCRANYPCPELAMASALNLRYLGDAVGPKSQYETMLSEHRLGKLLIEQGYRYYHLGGPVDGLRTSPLSNDNLRFSRMPTSFTDRLVSLTPLAPWLGEKDRRIQMLDKFERLDLLAQRNGPKLVVAYFTALQPPWTFNYDGGPLTSAMLVDRNERDNYVNQLGYVNARLERTIDAILAWTKGNAVIVVQGDEGPRIYDERTAAEDEGAELRRRTGVLNAVYLPDGKAKGKLTASLSGVNTFRLVLNECFGARLPLLPDRTFYWRGSDANGNPLFRHNISLLDVTDKLDGSAAIVVHQNR
jgi:hypothetical protein